MSSNCCVKCRKKFCASKVPMFQNLDCDEIEEIVSKIIHKEYSKGDVIFTEGDTADTLYFVNMGKIKLYKYNKEGKEQILHMMCEGDFFGELDLLKTSEYKFNSRAIESCKVCTLSKQEMKNIILKNPEIAIKLLESAGERLAEAENLAQNLSTNDVDSRMAYLLLSFIEKFGARDEKSENVMIKIPFSREDMANYIGVTRETISRKLKKFEDEKLINMIGPKIIIVTDEEGLRDYI